MRGSILGSTSGSILASAEDLAEERVPDQGLEGLGEKLPALPLDPALVGPRAVLHQERPEVSTRRLPRSSLRIPARPVLAAVPASSGRIDSTSSYPESGTVISSFRRRTQSGSSPSRRRRSSSGSPQVSSPAPPPGGG